MNKGKYCHKYWQVEDANLCYCRDKGQHLKSAGGNSVPVRVRLAAPKKRGPQRGPLFFGAANWARTHLNATVRWTVAEFRLDGIHTLM